MADDDHVDMWLFFTVIPSLCQLLTNFTSKMMSRNANARNIPHSHDMVFLDFEFE